MCHYSHVIGHRGLTGGKVYALFRTSRLTGGPYDYVGKVGVDPVNEPVAGRNVQKLNLVARLEPHAVLGANAPELQAASQIRADAALIPHH